MSLRRLAYISPQFPKVRHGFEAAELLSLTELVDVVVFSLRQADGQAWAWWRAIAKGQTQSVKIVSFSRARLLQLAIGVLLRRSSLVVRVLGEMLQLSRLDPRGGAKLFASALAGVGLSARMRRERCEWIHADFASAPATAGMAAAEVLGLGFSFCGHAMDVFSSIPAGRATREALRRKIAKAKLVFAENGRCIENLSALGAGRPSGPPLVLKRNGVLALPVLIGRPVSPPRVVGLGALEPKKGFDTLVKACALARQSCCDLELEIYGEGRERSRLERLARTLNFPVALQGAYKYSELSQILARATVVALLSRRMPTGDSDGVPTVLIEALAHGCAVVATPVGSITDLVMEGVTGWLVPPDNPAEAARAILEVVRNPDEAVRRALNGRDRVREEFLAARAARVMVQAINERLASCA